ncbi:MAG: tetratricopeptide repeat-containing serine protease family protein [Planctomycetaceae bacterium]|nr:tetratricopeptide repeat-containing serine protease family protein [Planctomycetaceae bacterium]
MRIRLFLLIVIFTSYSVCKASSPSIDELLVQAQAGDANSQYSLGIMYHVGRNVDQDYNEAIKWFSQSAQQGNAKAQYELAQMYENGQSVVQNYNLAFEWYAKSAIQSCAKAQYSLGRFYKDGVGTGRDYNQALSWFTMAAGQGMNEAQFELGVMYFKGHGVEQDDAEAEKWLIKAAQQNNAKAQYCLGLLYCKDRDDEIKHNYKEAVRWFSKAGAQNHIDSQYLLGVMYCRGEGVPQDYKTAAKWFTKAASQGSARAQLVLGACYWNGQGVAIDYVESLKWMSLATMNGDKDARLLKNEIRDKMTDAEIEEAQRRINKIKKVKGYLVEKETSLKNAGAASEKAEYTATGFFITSDGYILTAYHAVGKSENIQVLHNKQQYKAKIVGTDESLDIALLKIDGNDFSTLPLSDSTAHTGDAVFTIGYPQVSLQGTEPKFTEGSISSLSGSADNPNYFQISVPVQPGNSGGPLISQQGEVIGMVVARLNDISALLATGSVPQNVNYALKSTFILNFLNSTPQLAQKLTSNSSEKNRASAIDNAKKSVVLITARK